MSLVRIINGVYSQVGMKGRAVIAGIMGGLLPWVLYLSSKPVVRGEVAQVPSLADMALYTAVMACGFSSLVVIFYALSRSYREKRYAANAGYIAVAVIAVIANAAAFAFIVFAFKDLR